MTHSLDGLEQFIGQTDVKSRLKTSIEASKRKNKPLSHTLFHGPPGLGKTTLAELSAAERAVDIITTSGSALSVDKVAQALIQLETCDILFIDEIHRASIECEEKLYPALEENFVNLESENGSTEVGIAPFTLIGATTRKGILSRPLLTRFTYHFKLSFYSTEQLREVVLMMAQPDTYDVSITEKACIEVAKRSKGTPRVVRQIVEYLSDWQIVHEKEINGGNIKDILNKAGYFYKGLTKTQVEYLNFLSTNHRANNKRKGVSISAIANSIIEQESTIEQEIEPHLLRLGLIDKNSSGRKLTPKGREVLERVKKRVPFSLS